MKSALTNIERIIKPLEISRRLEEIANLEQDSDFWKNTKNVSEIGKERSRLVRLLETYKKASTAIYDASELFEISQNDPEVLEFLFEESRSLESSVRSVEIAVMLGGEHDCSDAIVTIQPGAGGTESQDWASILYRMYLRWCERRGFKVQLLDYQEGEEAGVKGVAFIIHGENAYGYMKSETGIHRLVRNSPFDANARRHTSFASVQVTPELEDDIHIVIEEKDIRIDTYRASGAGGQHINKTESAIRITHLPTGIVVQCQNDRSQHKNKSIALKMLKSKLYDLEISRQNQELSNHKKSEIGWGHQIRSYVLSPYQQVKDNRSNIAYSNVEAILDGDIDGVIEGVLVASSQSRSIE